MNAHTARYWIRRVRVAAILPAAFAACTEPVIHDVAPAPVRPALELLFSQGDASAVGETRVTVHLRDAGTARVSSYTVRVSYDTTRLAFLGESAGDDGAMRASNAANGQVRLAGALADGFAKGELTTLRFVVRSGDPRTAVRVSADELHSVAHANLLQGVAP